PAVIAALHGLAVEVAVGERDATMRTGITHGERFSLGGMAEDERNFKEHRGRELGTADFIAANGGIPEVPEETCVGGWILLRWKSGSRGFAHWFTNRSTEVSWAATSEREVGRSRPKHTAIRRSADGREVEVEDHGLAFGRDDFDVGVAGVEGGGEEIEVE